MILDMGLEVTTCLLQETKDPTKLMCEHLSSLDGRLGWLNTTQAKHEANTGKDATNNNDQSTFGSLTKQLQIFVTIGSNHALAMVLAWFNEDFYCSEVKLNAMRSKPLGKNGTFLNLDYEMSRSLL